MNMERFEEKYQLDRSRIRRYAFNAMYQLAMEIEAYQIAGCVEQEKASVKQYMRIGKRFNLLDAMAQYMEIVGAQ